MTKEQLVAISAGFIMGFWHYANHERIYHGMAHGVSLAPNQVQNMFAGHHALGGTRLFSIEQSEEDIIKQCNELRDRYEEQGRPLGLSGASSTASQPPKNESNGSGSGSGSGKQNRRRQRKKKMRGSAQKQHVKNHQGGHAAEIYDHIKKLLDTLQEQMSPSAAFARVLAAVTDMLCSAVKADPDVARAFVDHSVSDNALIGLRNRAIEEAKSADADTSRPLWAANAWWNASYFLTELLGITILKLSAHNILCPSTDPTQ